MIIDCPRCEGEGRLESGPPDHERRRCTDCGGAGTIEAPDDLPTLDSIELEVHEADTLRPPPPDGCLPGCSWPFHACRCGE